MIYCRIKDRATLPPGTPVRVKDVALIQGGNEKAGQQRIPCPDEAGVWTLEGIDVVRAITGACPGEDVSLTGPDVCYVHRAGPEKKDRMKPVRMVLAFLLLVAGSALALAWFHSDVGMPEAQMEVYRLITGKEAENPLFINIPYAVGVGLGVAFFYSLIGRRTISPMDVKLKQYRKDMEETEGREIPRE